MTPLIEVAPTWIDPSTRQASLDFYINQYLPAENVPANWTGNHATCNAGTTSVEFKAAVLSRINYFRAMAGIPDVSSLSDTYNSKAQAAALMMSCNRESNHYPPATWICYTPEGAEAAGNSNLFVGTYGPDAVSGYVMDSGPGNYFTGHRRWILYPPQEQMGTGDIPPSVEYPAANALWVIGDFGPRPATREPYIAWPPHGYVPYQVVYARWSFSYPYADFTNATVTMLSGETNVPLTLESVSDGFGDATLVWRPYDNDSSDPWPRPANDTTYTVTVSNVLIEGIPQTFTYDVTVFNPFPTYTVSYNSNGATSGTAPDSQTKVHDEALTLATNSGNLARTGYNFLGWNTQADGNGTSYAAGGLYTANASVTLYAKWTGYCVPSANPIADYISRVQLGAGDHSSAKEGYLDYTATNFTDLLQGSASNPLTITAFIDPQISADYVKAWVDFNQDYDFADPGEEFDLGSSTTPGSVPFNGNLAVPAGATLGATRLRVAVRWGTAPTPCGTTGYGEFEDYTVTITGAASTYTVTYNGNGNIGGTPPTDSNAYLSGDTVTVLGNTGALVKTGYTFAGWNTQADGLGTDYNAGDTFIIGSADVTLYARWTDQPTYTVTYNGNGNTGGTPPTDGNAYLSDVTVTVLGNTGALVKTGFTFAGWNTQADGLGTDYTAGDTFTMGAADVTLYARWTVAESYYVYLPLVMNNVTNASAGMALVPAGNFDRLRLFSQRRPFLWK